MATARLEKEVEEIFELIDAKKNFLLSGGAGSGKTFSLVSVINEIYSRNPKSKIACITYTNAAVHEIENRVTNKNIKISTIHDFLWENISSFQKELKIMLIESINNPEVKYKNINVETPYSNDFNDGIKYTEHLNLANGKISHDEIIVLANQMFKKYSKLCDILNDKYEYILVDEYQDTFPEVVEILLEFLSISKKNSIIGFFGDSMQSIYDDGIGDLEKYIKNFCVFEVQKKQNRRNPQIVIDLTNKLRTDGLGQEPSEDKNAPNMENGEVKQGSIKFLYGKEVSFDELESEIYFSGWDFNNSKETKELRLTHNLIADKVGFPSLMRIYDKDPVIKLKSEFVDFVKKQNINIDENQTFDAVIKSVDWRVSNRSKIIENRGRKQLEVFLDSKMNSALYDIVKDKPYTTVKRMYFDKDNLISDKKEIDEEKSTQSKRDKLIRHLFKIHEVVRLYENKEYNEFIRKTSFYIKSIFDKQIIKEKVDKLIKMQKDTIHDVIEYAHDSGLCLKDDNVLDFIKNNDYLYSIVSKVNYCEFVNLYMYLEGYAPFSTQHKIKGEEFKNVLVILNNGEWTKYNFEYLFNQSHEKCNPSVLKRTQKLFYVCCTRAKENLIVYCENPTEEMICTARYLFGDDNCIPIKNDKL